MASTAAVIKSFEPRIVLMGILFALCCWGTWVCNANADDNACGAKLTYGATTRGPALTIPRRDCGNAALVLARVTLHIRDAERSALYIADAEDQYDDTLQALIEGDCPAGIEHLRISGSDLLQQPNSEMFGSPLDTR